MRFDLEKMSWIGKAANEGRVMAIAQQSPIKTYQDLVAQTQPVNFAAAGIGSAAYVETVMLTAALKLPIKILTGYNGNDDMLAMRRGEVVGTISARSTWDPFVKQRLCALHRADRRRPDRRAAARAAGHRSRRARR